MPWLFKVLYKWLFIQTYYRFIQIKNHHPCSEVHLNAEFQLWPHCSFSNHVKYSTIIYPLTHPVASFDIPRTSASTEEKPKTQQWTCHVTYGPQWTNLTCYYVQDSSAVGHTLCVLKVVSPQRPNLILTTDIPDSEANVLVLDSLHIEACTKFAKQTKMCNHI